MARPQADLGKIVEESFKFLEKQLLEEKKKARRIRDPAVVGIMDKDAARIWKGILDAVAASQFRNPLPLRLLQVLQSIFPSLFGLEEDSVWSSANRIYTPRQLSWCHKKLGFVAVQAPFFFAGLVIFW
ncbi:hypothetical protein LOK49_LG12G01076 [Camellia lanceoleosa]|uniref:Uncharacterized protein n=1 Tax=Camellia lanceoleosa TaxID=1840588 RepID=A0ACC0FRJ7_9ERIC|nr:hypothetical protein LOK49_LG12G01076 [Camellia lanceoleosa]